MPVIAPALALDERDALAGTLDAGNVYVADRGYERETLFNAVVAAKSDDVIRVQRRPAVVVKARPLTAADRAAGVLADDVVTLGPAGKPSRAAAPTHPIRRVVIAGRGPGRRRSDRVSLDEVVVLTSLKDVPAAVVATVDESRWTVELFFRFVKQVLSLKRFWGSGEAAVTTQVYCALIACVLLAELAGGRVTVAAFRMTCLYLQGRADEGELEAFLASQEKARNKDPARQHTPCRTALG